MTARGELLGGRYRLVERLGEGGMGVVWLANDETLPREVALKLLHKSQMSDTEAVARFRAEAKIAAAIEHPGICSVLDLGEHDEAPYLVLERLRGESLAERLARKGALLPEEVMAIAEPLLEALMAAHRAGILHRDLKPENVFLCRSGERETVKILDFGVAKLLGSDDARVRLTRTGALIGTPAYMSPEQAKGDVVLDERSDVWSVGILLYEMLTGSLPYDEQNTVGLLVTIATRTSAQVTARLKNVPPRFLPALRGALTPDRNKRLASAEELLRVLREGARGTHRSGKTTPQFLTLNGRDSMPGNSRSHLWAVAGLGLAGVLAAAGVRMRGQSTVSASAPPAPRNTAHPVRHTPPATPTRIEPVRTVAAPAVIPEAGVSGTTSSVNVVVTEDAGSARPVRVRRRVVLPSGLGQEPDF